MSNYFIIHGTLGKPTENWFPWLTEKLIEHGKDVIIPCFPIKKEQSYEKWAKLLKYYYDLKMINEDTVFICHSIAPIFVSKFLIKNKIEVKALISVSGFNCLLNKEIDEMNKTFLMENEELAKINKYVKYIHCFYSDNDPYISRDELENFICTVKASKTLINGAGHFNTQSNYKEFPEMLEAIDKMEKTAFKKELL